MGKDEQSPLLIQDQNGITIKKNTSLHYYDNGIYEKEDHDIH